jgi:hypothetical protein
MLYAVVLEKKCVYLLVLNIQLCLLLIPFIIRITNDTKGATDCTSWYVRLVFPLYPLLNLLAFQLH